MTNMLLLGGRRWPLIIILLLICVALMLFFGTRNPTNGNDQGHESILSEEPSVDAEMDSQEPDLPDLTDQQLQLERLEQKQQGILEARELAQFNARNQMDNLIQMGERLSAEELASQQQKFKQLEQQIAKLSLQLDTLNSAKAILAELPPEDAKADGLTKQTTESLVQELSDNLRRNIAVFVATYDEQSLPSALKEWWVTNQNKESDNKRVDDEGER